MDFVPTTTKRNITPGTIIIVTMLTVGIFLVSYITLCTGISIYLHYQAHGVLNWMHMCLAFFLPLNMLICWWEVGLGLYIEKVKKDFVSIRRKWRGKEFAAIMDFFHKPLTLSNLVTLEFWTTVWSTYSLYDPSYQNMESFGFFVDVANGWSFFLPSGLLLWCMTNETLPLIEYTVSARVLGMLGLIINYAMLHGTVVYFASFFLNKRHKNFSKLEVGMFIGGSNGLWFIFPLVGLLACYQFVMTDSYQCVRV